MGMFTDGQGKTSSSRVISVSIITISLLMAVAIVVVGIIIALKNDDGSATPLLTSASAAGTLFITMGGASMFFLYNQKKGEIKAMAEVLKATNPNSESGSESYPYYSPSEPTYRTDEGEYDGEPIIQ